MYMAVSTDYSDQMNAFKFQNIEPDSWKYATYSIIVTNPFNWISLNTKSVNAQSDLHVPSIVFAG